MAGHASLRLALHCIKKLPLTHGESHMSHRITHLTHLQASLRQALLQHQECLARAKYQSLAAVQEAGRLGEKLGGGEGLGRYAGTLVLS